MWPHATAVSSSVICTFSKGLTEKRAAGERMLCFSVYLTLCHTDEKGAKGNPVVGSLSTMKIKDLLFSKYNYASAGARDLIIVLPKYNLSVGLILAFYFSISMVFLFSVTWTSIPVTQKWSCYNTFSFLSICFTHVCAVAIAFFTYCTGLL